MDVPAIEKALAASQARPLVADARLVRRVIKKHRHLPGVGLQVPHARCYWLPREALLDIVSARELGRVAADLPEQVVLLARPERDDVRRKPAAEILEQLWRDAFHALVHVEIDRLIATSVLTPARIRERIHRIGQTEFDEIRLVLRQDRQLLAPDDDGETYAEFAALYLELASFAPALVGEMFPTLTDPTAANAALAEDVDVARLLEASRPEGATRRHLDEAPPDADAALAEGSAAPLAPVSGAEAEALLVEARAARAEGNNVRAALLCVNVGALDEARGDAEALAARLSRVLRPAGAPDGEPGVDPAVDPGIDTAAWTAALLDLAQHAVARGGLFRRVEARLLYDVQSACLAGEKHIGKVDLVDWALALGRRPLARLLPATREIRVAYQLDRCVRKVPRLSIPEAGRKRLAELTAAARHRAGEILRDEMRPRVEQALVGVGFKPENIPERVGLAKVVAELLDQVGAHGHTNLGQLRDVVSRNQLKMHDLAGPGELLHGDALLAADRRLGKDLDGVHRRGEVYLRGLQKMSSLLFGTHLGRLLVLYVLLPIGGGFLIPFATPLIINELGELGRALHLLPRPPEEAHHHHHHHLTLPSLPWVVASTVVLFALIHSTAVRDVAFRALRAVGFLLAAVFVHVPRWILSRPLVQQVLGSPPMLAFRRFVLKPALIVVVVYVIALRGAPPMVAYPVMAVLFVAVSVLLNTSRGLLVEEIALDALVRWARTLQQQVVLGLFQLVARFFRWMTDALDRLIYTVDEWLRFRTGQARSALAAKAVLGLVWFAFAYVLRILVNLFIEPTFNPIKHFPTVTVAAKVMWATVGPALHGFLEPLLGALRAGTITGLAMSLLPGFFGFLVWELKENYKLYRATRPRALAPVMIGHHGETMGALLKPGIHSGTLPKLWAKLRRAARKGSPAVHKHREAMHELEEAVERFVDRELSVLALSGAFVGSVHVVRVVLASNRVRVDLHRAGHNGGAPHTPGQPGGHDTCTVTFEEQSGWLCAGVARAGWASTLQGNDRVLFENALGGLYHRAGVDLVRQQIEAVLPPAATYDIADEGLVVWLAGFATEIVYPLDAAAILQTSLQPTVRGAPAPEPPSPIDRAAIMFRDHALAWTEWVEVWGGAPHRVIKGASLLPQVPSESP
jgi:hypothetical protein